MSRTATRPTRTVQDRHADLEALHRQLAEQVEQLRSPQQWAAFLRVARSLHRYSWQNLILIASQCAARGINPQVIAGFRTFQGLGRQVRKGEKALRIFAPMRIKTEASDPHSGDTVEQTRTLFRIVSVFEVSQTDPIDGRDDLTTQLTGEVTGEDPSNVFGRLAGFLADRGWSVERATITTGARGYCTTDNTRRIVIDARLGGADACQVLIHEATHVLCGHVDDLDRYHQHRGAMETTAQSVAFIVAAQLGIDNTTISVQYVAGWLDGPDGHDALRTTLSEVLATSRTLLDVLAPAPDTTPDDHGHTLAA